MPQGYMKVKDTKTNSIIVPQANAGSAYVSTPDVATESAAQIYNTWKSNGPVKQTQGIKGGSALAGGLGNMAASNPYTLGAVVTHATLANVASDDTGDLQHVADLANVSLQRLIHGNTDNDKKGVVKGFDGEFNEKSYGAAMKQLRGEYAKAGISSKEIAYQLSNQAYSEGRFDESQTIALQRTADMVFDAKSYTLAQRLNTGKNKGFEIIRKRRG